MWSIFSAICFYGMALSPNQPLCWKDAKVPMDFENESSCILVRDQLAKQINVDLNARNIRMTLQCKEMKQDELLKEPMSL